MSNITSTEIHRDSIHPSGFTHCAQARIWSGSAVPHHHIPHTMPSLESNDKHNPCPLGFHPCLSLTVAHGGTRCCLCKKQHDSAASSHWTARAGRAVFRAAGHTHRGLCWYSASCHECGMTMVMRQCWCRHWHGAGSTSNVPAVPNIPSQSPHHHTGMSHSIPQRWTSPSPGRNNSHLLHSLSRESGASMSLNVVLN